MALDHHVDVAQRIASGAAYTVSGTLVAGSWSGVLSWMNDNAGVIGVIIAFATYITNLYFQAKRDKRESQRCE